MEDVNEGIGMIDDGNDSVLPQEVVEYTPLEQPEQQEIDLSKVRLSDHMKGPVRLEDELFCDYRCRLWWEKLALKQYQGGKTIWVGAQKGPMYNIEKSQRSNKGRNKKDAYNQRVEDLRKEQGCKRKQLSNQGVRRKIKRMLGSV